MRIVIPGDPIAKARVKFVCRGRHGMAYDAQSALMAEKRRQLIGIAKDSCLNELFMAAKTALRVEMEFHMPIAKSDSESKRNAKLWGVERPVTTPDYDNLAKWLDIANGVLWRDDAQIVSACIDEYYSDEPCTIIDIEVIKMQINDDAAKMTNIFSPAALHKFESDVSLLRVSLESLRLCQREEREQYLDAVAGSLKDFATTYGLALKKMATK